MRTLVALIMLVLALPAHATSVQDVTRIKNHGGSTLRGFGLVMGLSGTGDSGKDLALARTLAEVYRNNGITVEDIDELSKAKSVAVVNVLCEIPPVSAYENDRFDVTVSVVHAASSLAGGELYLTVLQGPVKGAEPYAIASGPIELDDADHKTKGRVRLGAQLIKDIPMEDIADSFMLVLNAEKAGHAASAEVAAAINAEYFGPAGANQIATAINEREILVRIPDEERANPAAFIAAVQSTPINVDLLRLGAQVIVNEAAGLIQVNGDVEISPGVITAEGLTITTTVPPPVATAENPMVERSRWTAVGTEMSEKQNAKLQDLLNALNRLDVPTSKQIQILFMLEKNGQLHGRIVRE